MKSFAPAHQAALAARRLLPRDFLTITARNRSTGAAESVGFWADLSEIGALVLDPNTGLPMLRTFRGAGSLVQISDIPATSGVNVQNVTIQMSQLDEMVEQAIRLYDVKQGRVEIHSGLLDPDSRNLVSPAEVIFVGFIDDLRILTPAENEDGGVTISCTGHTQEMLRTNPATRSHADQQTRAPGDDFFLDAAVVGDWDHYWGATGETKVETKKGIFGWGGFLGIF